MTISSIRLRSKWLDPKNFFCCWNILVLQNVIRGLSRRFMNVYQNSSYIFNISRHFSCHFLIFYLISELFIWKSELLRKWDILFEIKWTNHNFNFPDKLDEILTWMSEKLQERSWIQFTNDVLKDLYCTWKTYIETNY